MIPAFAESAESAFKAGARAEKKNNLDVAFLAYKQAHDAKPSDPKYMAAYLRLRLYAATKHIHDGEALRDEGKIQESLAEFRMAVQIDPSNFEALGQVRRTTDQIQKQLRDAELARQSKAQPSSIEIDARNAAGPVSLDFKGEMPISLHMTSTVDAIYKTIGRLAGFNVLMDPDYKPQKITFELKDVSLRDALSMIATQSKTFWRPLSANTIMVSADSGAKRKDLEQNVMKTFYLHNAATPADLQQAAGTLKAILDITHIQVTPDQRSLTLRCTPDQMVLAQKLLGDIDKPKSEVVIDVMVLEVSSDKIRNLGTNLPTTASASISPGGSSSSSSLTLNSFTSLGAGDISVSVSGASVTALASDSNSKVLQRPQIRAMDAEKASLKIGDRIPIATGSYQSGLSSGVNTQFQYIDVGVNVDITPYILSSNEVTLKMSLEVSSVTGEQTVDGVTEPTIGQRRIEHEARLYDGEVNLIGGILEDTETKSLSGYPLLTKIPILKNLFGQENKERVKTEIVFAITPHIIRSPEITDENMKMVDLGAGSTVTYRKAEVKTDAPEASPATAPAAVPAPAQSPAPASPVPQSGDKSAIAPGGSPSAKPLVKPVLLPQPAPDDKPRVLVRPALSDVAMSTH